MLNLEQQNELAKVLERKTHPLKNLVNSLDKVIAFYFDLHDEKLQKLRNLKSNLAVDASGKSTSIPDYFGVILKPAEVDRAEAHRCRACYHHIAKIVHPDHGGSADLFNIVRLAYQSRDMQLLDILYKAVQCDKIDLNTVKTVNERCNALISQLRTHACFKLIQLDPYLGTKGVNEQAKEEAGKILDKLIAGLTILLLKGNQPNVKQDSIQSE